MIVYNIITWSDDNGFWVMWAGAKDIQTFGEAERSAKASSQDYDYVTAVIDIPYGNFHDAEYAYNKVPEIIYFQGEKYKRGEE